MDVPMTVPMPEVFTPPISVEHVSVVGARTNIPDHPSVPQPIQVAIRMDPLPPCEKVTCSTLFCKGQQGPVVSSEKVRGFLGHGVVTMLSQP